MELYLVAGAASLVLVLYVFLSYFRKKESREDAEEIKIENEEERKKSRKRVIPGQSGGRTSQNSTPVNERRKRENSEQNKQNPKEIRENQRNANLQEGQQKRVSKKESFGEQGNQEKTQEKDGQQKRIGKKESFGEQGNHKIQEKENHQLKDEQQKRISKKESFGEQVNHKTQEKDGQQKRIGKKESFGEQVNHKIQEKDGQQNQGHKKNSSVELVNKEKTQTQGKDGQQKRISKKESLGDKNNHVKNQEKHGQQKKVNKKDLGEANQEKNQLKNIQDKKEQMQANNRDLIEEEHQENTLEKDPKTEIKKEVFSESPKMSRLKLPVQTTNDDSDFFPIPKTPMPKLSKITQVNAQNGAQLEHLQPESEEGNIEYKLKIIDPPSERFEQLVSQLKWRLTEGNGEAIYEIGVADNGSPIGLPEADLNASIETLKRMAKELEADVKLLRKREGENGKVAELLVRKVPSDQLFLEVRVAVTGNVDSGKSTLLGVLSKGILDNGRGLARLNVFRHKHEVASGRTSDISREILGFSSLGNIVNYSSGVKTPTWSEICEASCKVVMFIDLAGHAKYLKTTLFGLTGNFPDYTMMVVGANMGVVGMTKEHYHLALALRVPVFIVVTKIDMCPPNVLEQTMDALQKMLKAPGSRKIPIIISSEDDVVVASRNFDSERIAPIFLVSNVTGESLSLVKSFLNLIPARKDWEALKHKPVEFHVDSTFSVSGVGTVVSGTLMSGIVNTNQTLLLGPDEFGKFNPVQVKSIHTNRLPTKTAKAGQSVALALKKVKRSATRKGMVLLDSSLQATVKAVWEFEADILIITHSTTISLNYEAVIHCGCTRQAARVVGMNQEVLRSGSKATVRFRYKYHSEYLKVGERLIFREGRTKGIGKVVNLVFDSSQTATSASTSTTTTTTSTTTTTNATQPSLPTKTKETKSEAEVQENDTHSKSQTTHPNQVRNRNQTQPQVQHSKPKTGGMTPASTSQSKTKQGETQNTKNEKTHSSKQMNEPTSRSHASTPASGNTPNTTNANGTTKLSKAARKRLRKTEELQS